MFFALLDFIAFWIWLGIFLLAIICVIGLVIRFTKFCIKEPKFMMMLSCILIGGPYLCYLGSQSTFKPLTMIDNIEISCTNTTICLPTDNTPVNVISPSGKEYSIPGSEVNSALSKGWTISEKERKYWKTKYYHS